MVNARWKRMARSNDPISTRVDKDITLNDNIRIGVDASIRALLPQTSISSIAAVIQGSISKALRELMRIDVE